MSSPASHRTWLRLVSLVSSVLVAGWCLVPGSAAAGPRVYVQLKTPDPSRGVIKLVQHRNTTVTAVDADTALITERYQEICTEPCGVELDTSERPIYYFVRDGQPITHGFRLHDQSGTVTLEVQPTRNGLFLAGAATAWMLIGIPMLIAGLPRVWIADGTPGSAADFRRVRKAR